MSPSKKVPVIISAICSEYQLDEKRMISGARKNGRDSYTDYRYMIMYLIRIETDYTFDWIDKYFGYKCRGSVTQHAMEYIQYKAFKDKEFNRKIALFRVQFFELYKQNKYAQNPYTGGTP